MNGIWIRKEDELFLIQGVFIREREGFFDMVGTSHKSCYELCRSTNKKYLDIILNQIQEAIINKESVFSISLSVNTFRG